ncbi:aconitate hydratase [Sporomusa sp.]|uniref:aconitate hydratase n=1 Tax=Sporomusa sp. TaxID=2078658 RepID=UPI002C851EF1|nr:aconitate hydratase [Sporomusa sp.]HWR09990.1 aconitate hydratase [Sporomusa sp.]
MGLTIAEKLISQSLVAGQMIRGQRIGIRAHQTLSHDVNGVMSYLALEAMGLEKVQVELAVHYIDHNMIQADYKNSDDHRFLQDITAKLGVICSRPGSGICHQLHLEHWGVPGKTLIGADSHTVAAGGIGMLSIGVGRFDGAITMAGEPLYLTMPKIVNVRLSGQLPPFVSAKNIILELLRRVSITGGVGKIFEYTGPGVATLTVAERSSITNMGQETGATTSVFPSDENTRKWLRAYRREEQWVPLQADADAVYDEVIEIDLSLLEPLIALPHQPDRVVPVREAAGVKVDQVMMGSCTNTSLNDVLSIAHVLDGRPIHRDVDAGLYPATRTVIRESIARGAHDKILASGVRIFEPVCGGCNGCGFAPQSNGVSLRTTPRNFVGRSGTASDKVYLVAPETAAASALTGVITDPRELQLSPFIYEMPDIFIDDRDMFQQPSAEPETIVIRRGPNLRPIPAMPALPDVTSGEVLVKVGDDITTDHICPAGALYLPIRSNIPELSKHAFKVVDDTFADRAGKAGGGLIVGGANYGQGSSREQAVMVPRYLGVKAVIAKSFARLHLANLVNWGLLPLTFTNSDDFDTISQGDRLTFDTAVLSEGQHIIVKNETKAATIVVACPLCQEDLESIKAGGRLNQVKAKKRNS